MRDYFEVPMPSIAVIAAEKAKAFAKQLACSDAEAAKLFGLPLSENRETIYVTNGRSSSFKY